jgi:hypothetical protein
MKRYLVETPHSAEECEKLIKQVYAMGYLYHFDWGCDDGVHSGWAIIEAENEADARLTVPSLVRRSAKVVRLTKFTKDQIDNHQ